MDCADEAALIRHALAKPGIESLNFDLVGRRVDVTFNPERISAAAILDAVAATGLAAHTAPGRRSRRRRSSRARSPSRRREMVGDRQRRGAVDRLDHRRRLRRQLERGDLRPSRRARSATRIIRTRRSPTASPPFAGLWPMIPRALTSLRFGRLDMHVLVCLSAVGAAAIGQWAEAAAVAFLFAIAHLMEAWSIERARHAVSDARRPRARLGRRHAATKSAPVERWIERFAAVYTPVVTFAALAVVLVPPLVRRPMGRVVLSRADLPGARVPVRAGDLDAGDGRRGADLGGAARRAVQGRRAARARRHREGADAAGRARGRRRRAVPDPPSPEPASPAALAKADRRRADVRSRRGHRVPRQPLEARVAGDSAERDRSRWRRSSRSWCPRSSARRRCGSRWSPTPAPRSP